jgi:uncharacterized membrane protein YdjX (TVP38/TMEM64 family)
MIAVTSGTFRHFTWLGLLVLLIGVGVAWYFLPTKDFVHSFSASIREHGTWGAVAFAIVYVVVVVALAPAEIMSIAAGFIFGPFGFPLVVISATIGATLAFLISRYLVRERVKALVGRRPVLRAIDRTVGEEGWKIVLLLRLNPLVPFNLQNYFFGGTDIGLVPYAVSTFFGIMPGSAMYVYLGTLGQAVTSEQDRELPKIAFLIRSHRDGCRHFSCRAQGQTEIAGGVDDDWMILGLFGMLHISGRMALIT